MVIAEPAALVVEGDDEQVLALQLLEHLRRVIALEHRVAERGAHGLEDGGPEQELELRRLHAAELLGPQIVRDEAVVAAERPHRRAAAVQRESREIQTGGPALRTLVQRFGLGLGHVGSGRGEERVRFGVAQGKRGGPQLEQLAVGSELREAQPSLSTPGEDQLRPSRHVEEQRGKGVQAIVVLELVHVVEDEHERLGPSRQRRDEAREPARPQRVAGAAERLEHGGVDRRVGVQRLGDVRQKDDGIVVAVVERDPGEFATVVCRPLPEDRRLAVTGGCDDADDSTAALTGEAADERGALDEARPRRRHVELGRAEARTFSILPFGSSVFWAFCLLICRGGDTAPPV